LNEGARTGIRIGLHVANLPTLKSFINRTAREIDLVLKISVVDGELSFRT
jgi:hypothetical protein